MMQKHFRNLLTGLAALTMLFVTASPQAKEAPPKPEKMKKLSFPEFKEFETKNGIEVLVVEHHEQPVVSIFAVVKTGGAHDPDGKESLAGFTIDQLNKGTKSRSALELAEWIESVGGSVGSQSNQEWSALTVTVLTEHAEVAYQYLQDVFLNPTFPEDELNLLSKQAKTGLEFELSDPSAMARRHLRDRVYGDHPYAKQASVGAIEAISRDDLVSFYNKNFVANNAMIAVVGDVKAKKVKKAIQKYFGDWKTGTPDKVHYAGAPKGSDSKVFLYHKPGAVQTEIHVGHLGPKADNEDWASIVIANRILGGGADARLFMNLREEKGWTYGAYSSFSRERDQGMFTARAPVRTEVSDSALVELLSELNRIRDERVTDDDLKNAKSYLIGNFPIQIETPGQIAARIGQNKLLGLDQKSLESYRDRLAAVNVDDVKTAMNTHMHPDQAYYVLVGDANEIKDKVEVTAPVEMFDIAGEPLSLDAMTVQEATHDYDTSNLKNMKATYAVTVQEMNIGDLNVELEKTKDVIEVSQNIKGMISMEQNTEMNATTLSPITFSQKIQMGPQNLGADYSFTDGAGTGRVQSPESPEPRDVAFDLVGGTIMDTSLEFAVGCLPLAINTTYKFPVVSAQSGVLQNVTVTVVEMVDIETAAGNFRTFKVKVKSPDGDTYLYLGEDSPHILVKQEVPAQAMSLLLKSVAN